MFKITADFSRKQQGRGFQMTFQSGVTISVQFGMGNYCENRDGTLSTNEGDTISSTAEVALFTTSGKWVTRKALRDTGITEDHSDDVYGYATPDEVALLIAWASTQEK